MEIVEYTDGETTFEGKFFQNSNKSKKSPCLMVAHAWDGPNDHFDKLAENFSKNGISSFAIDIYGKGIRGKTNGDNSHLMNPLMNDRRKLHKRLLSSLAATKDLPNVNPCEIYILGFCFGGICALDLARLRPKGLVKTIAVHSGLDQPSDPKLENDIDSEILLLNGYEDPVAKPGQLHAFFEEMTNKNAKWTAKVYGKTKHAFTFKGVNIPKLGIEYNEQSSNDAYMAIDRFLGISKIKEY